MRMRGLAGLVILAGLAGCTTTESTTRRTDPRPNEDKPLLAHTPAACFENIRKGVLANDAPAVFANFSELTQFQQGKIAGFTRELNEHHSDYVRQWRDARIEAGSMKYEQGDSRAVCRVKWGDGKSSGVAFVKERADWKLATIVEAIKEPGNQ